MGTFKLAVVSTNFIHHLLNICFVYLDINDAIKRIKYFMLNARA